MDNKCVVKIPHIATFFCLFEVKNKLKFYIKYMILLNNIKNNEHY